MEDFLYLVRWDGKGKLERWKVVLPDGSSVRIEHTVHQICVSRDYLVLIDTAFKGDLAQVLDKVFPQSKEFSKFWRKLLTRAVSPDTTIYIVRRADLKTGQCPLSSEQEVEVVARKLVIPLNGVHYLADYENPQERMTIHAGHFCGWDVAEWLRGFDNSSYAENTPPRSGLRGMLQSQMDIGRLGRYTLNGESAELIKSEVIHDSKCTWHLGLYTYREILPSGLPPKQIDNIYWVSFGLWKDMMTDFIVDMYKDYKYRVLPVSEVLRLAQEGLPASLLRLDALKMEIADRYEFPSGYFAITPQFIPRSDDESSTNGYISCTVFSPNSSEIWIFDAENLAVGPLCKLGHSSLDFGFTIHGAWLPKIARRNSSYHIPVRQDYDEIVKQKSPEIQELFEKEIYPHFER